ncbi:transposase [Chryseobacterium arachidis]|uniref:transposase n=1 Tax=Chryseobacterium arachidis TaxID=1416778 RepID=UPI003605C41E
MVIPEKQLLARSRYLLYKSKEKWTLGQSHRAEIFILPVSRSGKKAYCLSDELRKIYNQNITKICCYAQVGALVQKR